MNTTLPAERKSHAKPPTPGEADARFVLPLSAVSRADIPRVGGKGANLGEMAAAGLPVPPGFVVTLASYERFAGASALDGRIAREAGDLNAENSSALAGLAARVKHLVLATPVPAEVRLAIEQAYASLADNGQAAAVAVRSSATAEDTAEFSFAGMHESFLGVQGADAVVEAVRNCRASAYGARAIYYRVRHGFPLAMGLAVVVQRMVRSVKSGVMFTADPATGDTGKIVIEAAWGLGEVVVGGQVTPDHHELDKTTLQSRLRQIARKEFLLEYSADAHGTRQVELLNDPRATAPVLEDSEVRALGAIARMVESHYGTPQDIEFAIDVRGTMSLVQARPITTIRKGAAPIGGAASGAAVATRDGAVAARERVALQGLGASPGSATGRARILMATSEGAALQPGEILVAHLTSPDWVPLMRKAAGVVTDAGGMTSHAAIVSRELGIPCVVGTGDATLRIKPGTLIAIDGSAGTVREADASAPRTEPVPPPRPQAVPSRGPSLVTATRLYVNLAQPDRADEVALMDVDGVGLLRAEFMLLEALERTHPLELIAQGKGSEFVDRMSAKLEVIARAFAPRPVIYRATDFRSNEFRSLAGGEKHEPHEENPMIGFRGCYRYVKDPALFRLELEALHRVRAKYPNLHLMIPFVRTGWEFRACKRIIDESQLAGDRTMQLWVMAEVPSVVSWLAEYASLGVTGVSIGSNDLTQLILGVDRDSELVAALFDERDRAVVDAVRAIIAESHRLGLTVSICGQAPSVHPEYAALLVRAGIDSISVNTDSIDLARRNIAAAERSVMLDAARRDA